MPELPLLVFPVARTIAPQTGTPFAPKKPHFPAHGTQAQRLSIQLGNLQTDFARYRASITGAVDGLEPETVLVIEIAGSVDDFKQAVDATNGLEWLGEWDLEEGADDDFYEVNTRGERTEKLVSGRMFLSMTNEAGMRELLALWETWERSQALPRGKTKWRDVFAQTRKIRRWGIEETLEETGMLQRWRELLDPINPAETIYCQVELFYRRTEARRRRNEEAIRALLAEINGRTLGSFIDMPAIAFHAVKVAFPAARAGELLATLDAAERRIDIHLFKFPGIMYFRPTGQTVASSEEDAGLPAVFPDGTPVEPPTVAILDGAPSLQHAALRGRIAFDDPFDLAGLYQPGERRHGTAMASLVIHGERTDPAGAPLTRQVYHVPVMQPNERARLFRQHEEHFPDDVFFEDRIERAVRRMFEQDGATPPQAPGVKIINVSIGDPERPFIHTPSPWARLLDWLAWKHRVLFCVSAGNFDGPIDLGISHAAFTALSEDAKAVQIIRSVASQLSSRRLLAPGEALNVLTIGALNADQSGDFVPGPRVSLMENDRLFSLICRFGHGFRRSVKPEVFFPGGRQLYTPPVGELQPYALARSLIAPGQRVAHDSSQPGDQTHCVFTRGTSNATALATRAAAQILDALSEVRSEQGTPIPDDLLSVLTKALLVHGARHDEGGSRALAASLRNAGNSRKFREVTARYMGYGAVDVARVIACTEQRGTALACGEISENEIHEYRFPLPRDLSGSELWRRMVITLAWFSPMNFQHRNLREAKLEVQPAHAWDQLPLKLKRVNADHNQVLRGTVQHEVLEARDRIEAFQDGNDIVLHVACAKDATERLDRVIPYGLAVTLEVGEGVAIPIYSQIRAAIRQQVRVPV